MSSKSVVPRTIGLAIPLIVGMAACEALAQPPIAVAPGSHDLLPYQSMGLALARPYVRGRTPVVFVHGLWMTPTSWRRLIEALEADPALNDRFQFWTFGYGGHLCQDSPEGIDEVRRILREHGREP